MHSINIVAFEVPLGGDGGGEDRIGHDAGDVIGSVFGEMEESWTPVSQRPLGWLISSLEHTADLFCIKCSD